MEKFQMKLRRIVVISILSCAVLLVFSISVIISKDEEIDKSDLIFADNYISYILNNETVFINIYGAKRNQINLNDTITGAKLNNENIDVVSFEIDSSTNNTEYQLFNLMLEIQVLNSEIEKADTLEINFNNDFSFKYKVGKIIVTNEIQTSDHITYDNEFMVGYPKPSLYTNITNISDKSIIVNKISDLNDLLTYDYSGKFVVAPDESSEIDIPSFNEKPNQYDFYTITPIIHYTLNDNAHKFDLPTVIYGLLDDDDVKLSRILN